jgi:hypothetical protein
VSFTVLPGFEQLTQERYARLEYVNRCLSEFVQAYDRYMLAISGTDEREILDATADLDRQYELLDALGDDRP